MSISVEQLNQIQIRLAANSKRKAPESTNEGVEAGQEGKLQAEIAADLRGRRWLFEQTPFGRHVISKIGSPDFKIWPPDIKPFFIECKTRTGKLSKEQQIFKHCAEASGYRFLVIRSFQQYVEELNVPCEPSGDCDVKNQKP